MKRHLRPRFPPFERAGGNAPITPLFGVTECNIFCNLAVSVPLVFCFTPSYPHFCKIIFASLGWFVTVYSSAVKSVSFEWTTACVIFRRFVSTRFVQVLDLIPKQGKERLMKIQFWFKCTFLRYKAGLKCWAPSSCSV